MLTTRRIAGTAGVLLLVAIVSIGCGPKRSNDPGSGGYNPGPQQPNNPPPERKRFSWSLPIGDVSPNYQEKEVYDAVHGGDCAGAQKALDDLYGAFESPRNVLLAQAAIHFCKGESADGTAMFRRAEKLGWKGLLAPGDTQPRPACEFYKALSSVIEQQPPSAYTCHRGEPPAWKAQVDPRDQ